MEDLFAQLGVGGILAIMIAKESFAALRKRSNGAPPKIEVVTADEWRRVSDQVRDLYDWHNKSDADGVKVWYVRQSLESAIRRLGDIMELHGKLLERLVQTQDRMESEIKELRE